MFISCFDFTCFDCVYCLLFAGFGFGFIVDVFVVGWYVLLWVFCCFLFECFLGCCLLFGFVLLGWLEDGCWLSIWFWLWVVCLFVVLLFGYLLVCWFFCLCLVWCVDFDLLFAMLCDCVIWHTCLFCAYNFAFC